MSVEPEYEDSNKALSDRFFRDEKLMNANLFDIAPLVEKREEYAKQLNSNEELKEIESGYDDRLDRQKSKNERRQKRVSDLIYILVISFFMAAGVSVSKYFDEYLPGQQNQVAKTNKTGDVAVVTIFTILGAIVSFVFADRPKRQWNTKNANEFYNRLIVRCFDKMHDAIPEMTEDAILTFNPDLSRVVYALLIANMSKKDIAKLDSLAMAIATEAEKQVFDDGLGFINNQIHDAMKIVERALIKNPELCKIVQDAYMGKIPATFYLGNRVNTL